MSIMLSSGVCVYNHTSLYLAWVLVWRRDPFDVRLQVCHQLAFIVRLVFGRQDDERLHHLGEERTFRPSPISLPLTSTLALSALSYKSAPELASVQGLILREKQHAPSLP